MPYLEDMSKSYLVADIGGTSSRYAIFQGENSSELVKTDSLWLKTAEYRDFPSQLRDLETRGFIKSFSSLSAFVVAGAGPASGPKFIGLTQVDWDIDLDALPEQLSVPSSRALNDFAAQAYSCVSPISKEADLVLEGTEDRQGAIAVIGAGTGLGVAALITDTSSGMSQKFSVIPSEGGHINYPAETDQEFDFAKFVARELGVRYASLEDTLSGRGLRLTHKFITGEDVSSEEVSKNLANHPATLAFFARNYGRACRNVALEFIATGGVFVAGGIAARNREILQHPAFKSGFRESRQHQALIAKIPVRLLDNQESGLWGAAYLATQIG